MSGFCRYCGVSKPREGEEEKHIPIAHGMVTKGDGKSIWTDELATSSSQTAHPKLTEMDSSIQERLRDALQACARTRVGMLSTYEEEKAEKTLAQINALVSEAIGMPENDWVMGDQRQIDRLASRDELRDDIRNRWYGKDAA